MGAGLVRVVFSVCGRLLGWLRVWLGSLGVSCFRLGVLSLFVEYLYGCRKSFRDKPARAYALESFPAGGCRPCLSSAGSDSPRPSSSSPVAFVPASAPFSAADLSQVWLLLVSANGRGPLVAVTYDAAVARVQARLEQENRRYSLGYHGQCSSLIWRNVSLQNAKLTI